MLARSKVARSSAQYSPGILTGISLGAGLRPDAKASLPADKREIARNVTELSELAEGLCSHALDKNTHGSQSMFEELQAQVWEVRPLVRPDIAARLSRQAREVRIALGRRKLAGAALAAAEIYRLAVREIPWDAREVPLRVCLLNYAALKLMALSRNAALDWNEIFGAIGEAVVSAARLERLAPGRGLSGIAEDINALLTEAARTLEPWRIEEAARDIHVMAVRLACQPPVSPV